MKKLSIIILYAILIYFSYLMVLITLQYIPMQFDVAFLIFKEEELKYWYYQVAFFTHVYTSIFVLLFGMVQFLTPLQKQVPVVHSFLGKAYVLLILLAAAPSGIIMGYHANGGVSSQISFCTLAILWFYFTWRGYWEIKKKNKQAHQEFMLLSYALTLSAISLRLLKWGISNTLELPPMDTYRIVAWLGWVINLVVAYTWIKLKKLKREGGTIL